MNDENILDKLFARGNSYWLTRFVILRLVGVVYAVAFLVAAQQLVPLVGEHGLTPASHFLNGIQTQLRSHTAGIMQVPTLFWFGISDNALSIFAWTGFGLSLVVLGGYAMRILLTILWAMYMSIVHIGQIWYGYGLGDSAARDRVLVDLSLPIDRWTSIPEMPSADPRLLGFFAGSGFAS
jgi:hypothetical protein